LNTCQAHRKIIEWNRDGETRGFTGVSGVFCGPLVVGFDPFDGFDSTISVVEEKQEIHSYE
jgi:hypothetical protein